MKLVIVTGMSGAGKSTSLKMLEDMGYFCIDNLPVFLIEKFSELINTSNTELSKVAIGVDARTGLKDMDAALKTFEKNNVDYEILFLEAADDVIISNLIYRLSRSCLASHNACNKSVPRQKRS